MSIVIDREPNSYINGSITSATTQERIDEVKVAQIEEMIRSGFFGNIDFKDDIDSLGKTGSIFDLNAGDYDFDL